MTIHGTVVHGKQEGRAVGYPTANVSYDSTSSSEAGIWIVRALLDFRVVRGVAVVGMWKTSNDLPSVEVHFFDFQKEVYGKECAVVFLKKIRDIEQFSAIPALVAQIEKDISFAKEYFERSTKESLVS